MYRLKPYFYDDFHCIGSECCYTCCGGWTIALGKETVEKYKQCEGYLKRTIENNLICWPEMDMYTIRMDKDKMCPFCNEEQLCMIVKEKGEQFLDGVCKQFPREKFVSKDMEENYLSLGCPAVVAFLQKCKGTLSFILEDDGKEEEKLKYASGKEKKAVELLYEFIDMDMEIRNCMVDILQNRKWPLWFREFFVAACLDKIKDAHNQGKAEEVYGTLKRMLEPEFTQTLMVKLVSACRNGEKQFMALRTLTYSFRDMMDSQMFSGRNGLYITKVSELMNQNLNISYEEYRTVCDKWKQKKEEDFDILAEHIAAYTWMHYAMTAFTKYYMVDNYWDVILVVILIKHLCIMQYSLEEELDEKDVEFIVSLVCRTIHHGRTNMGRKLNDLKKVNQLSVASLFMLISP